MCTPQYYEALLHLAAIDDEMNNLAKPEATPEELERLVDLVEELRQGWEALGEVPADPADEARFALDEATIARGRAIRERLDARARAEEMMDEGEL